VTRFLLLLTLIGLTAGAASAATMSSINVPVVIRGRTQMVHLYGHRGAPPAIVSSGDGGWIHLAPHAAEMLAAHGWFVVGVDARAYLSSATTTAPLTLRDVAHDYSTLVSFAAHGAQRPVLIGISEGAGLSVAAAADPAMQRTIGGVVAIGLGDNNELAWHLRDAIVYVTKGTPREPLFHATDIIGRAAPLPLAMMRPTVDEFVPRSESERIFAAAREPKMLWTIAAGDHRFSNNEREFDARLIEALDWISAARH